MSWVFWLLHNAEDFVSRNNPLWKWKFKQKTFSCLFDHSWLQSLFALSVTDKFWELTSNKPISKLDLTFLTMKYNLCCWFCIWYLHFGPSGTSKSIFKWTDNLGTNGFTEAKPRRWCLTPEDMGDVQFSCKIAFLMHVPNPHHDFREFLRVKGEWGWSDQHS